MKVLQWFCLLAAAIALVAFFSISHRNGSEVLKLRAEIREMSSIPDELAERRHLADEYSEVERLQKDATEVRKLRDEAQQLRTDNETLRQQVQFLEMQRAQNLEQNQAVRDQQVSAQQQRIQNEKAILRKYAESLKPPVDPEKANICVANLKQIDGAIEQWALENRKQLGELPTWEMLVGEQGYIRSMPVCPAGGAYTLMGVGDPPLCNKPGHHLPE